jgi:hypothetical protein
MFWKRKRNGLDEDTAIRRVLGAASARPGASGDDVPPPFFVARVRARAAEAHARSTEHPVGVMAWQMLPALSLIVVALAAWTGYESEAASRDRAEVVANMLRQDGGASEVVITAMLIGGAARDSGGAQ